MLLFLFYFDGAKVVNYFQSTKYYWSFNTTLTQV